MKLLQTIESSIKYCTNSHAEFDQTSADLDLEISSKNDLLEKFNFEKNLYHAAICHKEKEISTMEYIVLQKNPADFANYEFLFKKEMEIYNKMKVENNYLFSKGDSVTEELKEMIKIYKEIAHIELEKTKEGFLKIIFFRDIKPNFEGGSLVVEIKEGTFKVISVFPRIKITSFEEELKVSQNFTLFLTKVANEFLKELK